MVNFIKWLLPMVFIASAMLMSTFTVGCASPEYIEPTRQPLGIETPGIRFYPPANEDGLVALPVGFKPCGQFTARVRMEDGSILTLSGCLYCAIDPNDRTVYVQHNCTGRYRKGIKEPAPGGPVSPQVVEVIEVSGEVTGEQSSLKFVTSDHFEIVPAMKIAALHDVVIEIDGLPMSNYPDGTVFPSGTSILVKGDSWTVASMMYWSFGSSRIVGTTWSGDTFEMNVGLTEPDPDATEEDIYGDFGAVLVFSINGLPVSIGHMWFPD